MIELGPAVEDDDRCTFSDFPGIQLSASYRDAAFPRRAGLFALQLAIEPEGTHAAYVHARIAGTSVVFRALKPITPYGKPLS